jgi:heme oxygenase
MDTTTTTTTTTATESVLTRLRRETRPAHERAESLVGMPRSLDAHAVTLAAFLGFLEPWEHAVASALTPVAERLAGRGKTHLLADDLRALGWSHHAVAAVPRCSSLPRVDSLPRALGSMYVFEGATLGGVLVSRHVENTFGLRDGVGYAFHRSYGPRVGEMWRGFGQVLIDAAAAAGDDHHHPHDAADHIVGGATDTFDALCRWFEGLPRLHPPR